MKKTHFLPSFSKLDTSRFWTRAKIGICAKIEKLPHLPISTILLHHQLNFTATSILTFHISAFIANECININFKSLEVITKLEPNTRWHWRLKQDDKMGTDIIWKNGNQFNVKQLGTILAIISQGLQLRLVSLILDFHNLQNSDEYVYTISLILKKSPTQNQSSGVKKIDIISSGQGMQFDICWDRSIWGNRARNPLSLFSRNCNEGSSLLARWGNIYPSPESRQTYLHTNPYKVTEICQTDESTFNLLFKAKRKDKKLGREPLQILEAKF